MDANGTGEVDVRLGERGERLDALVKVPGAAMRVLVLLSRDRCMTCGSRVSPSSHHLCLLFRGREASELKLN
jgi:hypothetical protein